MKRPDNWHLPQIKIRPLFKNEKGKLKHSNGSFFLLICNECLLLVPEEEINSPNSNLSGFVDAGLGLAAVGAAAAAPIAAILAGAAAGFFSNSGIRDSQNRYVPAAHEVCEHFGIDPMKTIISWAKNISVSSKKAKFNVLLLAQSAYQINVAGDMIWFGEERQGQIYGIYLDIPDKQSEVISWFEKAGITYEARK